MDSYKVVTNLSADIPGAPDVTDRPHYLTTLGPAIRPAQDVRTGNIYGAAWTRADIDLLLACSTISEADQLNARWETGRQTGVISPTTHNPSQ